MSRSTTPQQRSNSSLCTDHRLDEGGGTCAWKAIPRPNPNLSQIFPHMFIHRYPSTSPGDVLSRWRSGNHYTETGKGHSSFQKLNCSLVCSKSYLFWPRIATATQSDTKKSSKQTIDIRQPCGYALAVVEFGTREVLKIVLKRGENVMKELIAWLESLAKRIYLDERKHYTFTGEASYAREEAYTCWTCETEFGENDKVVLDHCHYTNKFLGWAHNECNINRKTAN